MLKVIFLRILAIISIVIGEFGLISGVFTFGTFVPHTLAGFLKLLGAIALMFACFLLAIYCGWKADDIEDEINDNGKNDLLPFL